MRRYKLSKSERRRKILRYEKYYANLWKINRKSTPWREAYFGARSIATTQYQRQGKKKKVTTQENKESIVESYWKLKGK